MRNTGFTLVELIAVLVLVGILSISVLGRVFPSASFELQASRDQVVSAFFSAQQLAMVQRSPVQLITSSSAVDIRVDSNANGSFEASESVRTDGVRFPFSLKPAQTLSAATFNFDRLGRTTAMDLTLAQSAASVTISISSSGYAR